MSFHWAWLRNWASRPRHTHTHITSNGWIKVKAFTLIPDVWFHFLSGKIIEMNFGATWFRWMLVIFYWVVLGCLIEKWCIMGFWIPTPSPMEEKGSPWCHYTLLKFPNTQTTEITWQIGVLFACSEPLPKASYHKFRAFRERILASQEESESHLLNHPI